MKKSKSEIRDNIRIKKALETYELMKQRSKMTINIEISSLRKYLLMNFNINCSSMEIVRIVRKYFADLSIDYRDTPSVVSRNTQPESMHIKEEYLCRSCLNEYECWGLKNQCEYYKAKPTYNVPNYWPKQMGFRK